MDFFIVDAAEYFLRPNIHKSSARQIDINTNKHASEVPKKLNNIRETFELTIVADDFAFYQ